MPSPTPDILAQWESWWGRDNSRAVAYIIHPQGSFSSLDPYRKDWMPKQVIEAWDHWKPELMASRALELFLQHGDDRVLEEWLDYMEAYAPLYGHAAAGYRFLCSGFGPACLSAFLTGSFRYAEPTVWLEPEEPWTFAAIRAAVDDPPPAAQAYRKAAFELLDRMVQRLSPYYVLSLPDFGDGMDILSALRHNLNLLTDLYDEPEEIRKTLAAVSRFAREMHDEASRRIFPANGGACATVMRYLSDGPHFMTYSDFCAMIGPDHFAEFVAPMVREHCARFPHRTIYHLDGPGELPHVPQLCDIESLFAVQWVQGAGNPGPLDPEWDGLYRQLLDAGKRISIGAPADVEQLGPFFRKFPESEFTLFIRVPDAASASALASRFSP